MTGIKGVLLDLSGVLYVGAQPLPGACEALSRLQTSGLPLACVTNTTRQTRSAIHAKLAGMGFRIAESDIFTAPGAVRTHLEQQGLTPSLLIHPALEPEFADLAGPRPDAVVLGDAGEDFTYAALNRAFRLLMDGAPLISMGDNRYFQEASGLSLDIGPFMAALEYAADVKALVLGKPAPEFFHAAVQALGCRPAEALMIGDDALADVEGALNAGLQAWLVRTGKYRPGDEARIKMPGAEIIEDFAAAVDKLLGC
jgi:HAD superfamily hydrolase (TIGR01458 family)